MYVRIQSGPQNEFFKNDLTRNTFKGGNHKNVLGNFNLFFKLNELLECLILLDSRKNAIQN